MKQLLLIRHAKSSWADAGMEDFDRPLNERGKNDAPEMARRLVNRNVFIDAFVSSSAKRARKTCAAFMEMYKRKEADMVLKPELYLAPPEQFIHVINSLNDRIETAALFAHNPGITDFANSLTKTKVDDMPTCAIYAIHADTEKWKHFETAKKTFWFFDYPKLF